MKIIKLKSNQFLKGRMRRKGEIITVKDSFDGGKVVARNIEVKNKAKHKKSKKLKKKKHDKSK